MNGPHSMNGHQINSRLTKPQLRKRLADALETLRKEEIQLVAYQEKMLETQAEIVELKEMAERTQSAEKELGQAQSSMEKISIKLTELHKENDNLKRANQTLQKENEYLHDQFRTTEEKVSRQTAITKREQYEAERQRLQLESKISELEGRIQELQKMTITLKEKLASAIQSEMHSEDIMAPRASFRIDLYPHEGDYQGKIEHLLTREKRAIKGLEQSEIMQFISSHLPCLGKQPERTEAIQLSVSEEGKSKGDVQKLLSELNAMRPGAEIPRNFIICRKEPFQIHLKIDLSNVRPSDLPLVYRLRVYAKHLQSRAREIIGETASIITSAGAFPITIRAKALPNGLYRLQADLTSKLKGKAGPYASFIEGGLIQIY